MLVVLTLVSCGENGDSENCVQVGGNQEDCIAHEKCRWVQADLTLLQEDGCLVGQSGTWYGSREMHLGVCVRRADPVRPDTVVPDDGRGQPDRVKMCRRESRNLALVLLLDMAEHSIRGLSPGWEPCFLEYSGIWEPVGSMIIGNCTSVCGNGILEPGEECEGEFNHTGIMCGELTHWWGSGNNDGHVTCQECRWDFSACQMP